MPLASLGRALLAEIYQHALCPLEGVTITAKPEGGGWQCVPPVPAALLCSQRAVYKTTKHLLYGRNVFSFHMTCAQILQFLQQLPSPREGRLWIRHVRLSNLCVDETNRENRSV
jgi:hypothetical protein